MPITLTMRIQHSPTVFLTASTSSSSASLPPKPASTTIATT